MSLFEEFKKKIDEETKRLERKAFVTHIDGQKLYGEGYEIVIWFRQDIDAIIDAILKELLEKKKENP